MLRTAAAQEVLALAPRAWSKQLSAEDKAHRGNYFAETTEAIWPWIIGFVRVWATIIGNAIRNPLGRNQQLGSCKKDTPE